MLRISEANGPCSPLLQRDGNRRATTNYSERLRVDGMRIEYIDSRSSSPSNVSSTGISSAAVSIPAKILGVGHTVTVGLGTPPVQEILLFDTVSDLTWFRCQSCSSEKETCSLDRFDPSRSYTFKLVGCNETTCDEISSHPEGQTCEPSSQACLFRKLYGYYRGRKLETTGVLSRDTLTLSSTVAATNFVFGCSHAASVHLEFIAGVLGLGRGAIALPTQQPDVFYGGFSYCLPSTPSKEGHLTLGGHNPRSTFEYTPMITSRPLFYFVELKGIGVGGKMLPFDSSTFSKRGTILDSGTQLTYLPPPVYQSLRDNFRKGMSNYTRAPPLGVLDTCYDLTGYANLTAPLISLHFGGGLHLKLAPPQMAFYAGDGTTHIYCLAFAANPGASAPSIVGSILQANREVHYDVANSRIGFAPGTGTCASSK